MSMSKRFGYFEFPKVDYYNVIQENYNLIIMFPSELRHEEILQDNIKIMIKTIGEYIDETEVYEECLGNIIHLHFDSQKKLMRNQLRQQKLKIDKMAKKINDGISPYVWKYTSGISGYLNGEYVDCDYVIYLDDK